MEFFQNDMLNYYVSQSGSPVYKVAFQYAADKEENKAALNFHLTKREEKDIINAVSSVSNQQSFKKLMEIFEKSKTITPTPAGKGGNIFLLR